MLFAPKKLKEVLSDHLFLHAANIKNYCLIINLLIMLKYFAGLLVMVLLFSCKKTDTINGNGIAGNWKLIEVLVDPGNLSGEFEPVQSNKKITFNTFNTFECNGDICDMSLETNSGSSGTYNQADGRILPNDCPSVSLGFTVTGNTLLISYPCIEPCTAKFVRVR